MIFEVACARAVAGLLCFHPGKCAVTVDQHTDNRGPGGCDQFFLNFAGINRSVFEQVERGRSRHGKSAMGALHHSAAHVERRADPFVHTQRLSSHGGAGDVRNGINRADFVEVDLLDIHVMHACLGCAQSFKDSDGPLFGGSADGRSIDDLANLFQPAMRVLMSVVVRVTMLMLVMMLMRMAVFVFMFMSVFMIVRMRMSMAVFFRLMMAVAGGVIFFLKEFLAWQLFFTRSHNVHFDAADAAAVG